MAARIGVWGILVPTITAVAGAAPPNVLFIAVDDLRPELGCYGAEHVESPNIDRLASSGVRFARAHCQQAVCNPSRASLLTGLRPDRTRVWDLVTHFRDTVPDVVTLPQHFRREGYRAVAYGKLFHNPLPDEASWDEPNHWPKRARVWSRKSLEGLAREKARMRAAGRPEAAVRRLRGPATEDEDVPDSVRPDGEIAESAIAALGRLAKGDEPFFLAVGFVRPHLPFVAPRKYWSLYDRTSIPLAADAKPPNAAPRFAINTMYELRDYMDFVETPGPFAGSLTVEQQRRLKHGYLAAVSFVDALVGRLLVELEQLELDVNTIVVLWSDHGWKLGEHNSWCKQTNFEIDTRVPLIVRAPGRTGNGKSCNALVELLDVYPTLCELAGLEPPDHLQGRSLVPLLEQPGRDWPHAAFSQFRRRTRGGEVMGYAMRTDRYRYVEWLDRSTARTVARELYDHDTDPGERENVAAARRDVNETLSRRLWTELPRPTPVRVPEK